MYEILLSCEPLVRPPRNPSLFLKWKESIPEIEVLTLDDRVCELHFKEEDIIRYFEVDVQGVVNKIPLCRSRLKDGAVPSSNHVAG